MVAAHGISRGPARYWIGPIANLRGRHNGRYFGHYLYCHLPHDRRARPLSQMAVHHMRQKVLWPQAQPVDNKTSPFIPLVPAADSLDHCGAHVCPIVRRVYNCTLGIVVKMGSGYTLVCSSCGHAQRFVMGIGFAYGSLRDVLSEIPKHYRVRVLAILDSPEYENAEYGHALFHCPKCHGRYSRFHFQIRFGQSQVFASTHSCPKCRVEMEHENLSEEEEETAYRLWPCVRCGKTTLQMKNRILWD